MNAKSNGVKYMIELLRNQYSFHFAIEQMHFEISAQTVTTVPRVGFESGTP